MHELRRQGVTIKRIAEQYRLDRSTVSGTKNVTLKGGRVFGKLADATASVDLSAAAIVLQSLRR